MSKKKLLGYILLIPGMLFILATIICIVIFVIEICTNPTKHPEFFILVYILLLSICSFIGISLIQGNDYE